MNGVVRPLATTREVAVDMAKKGRAHDEEAWRNAKKICRLNARQVEMARALGMNPKKLPRLRPSPQQRWKLPVGEFIEELYVKRFDRAPLGHHAHVSEPGSRKPSPADQDAHTPQRETDAARQAEDLVCYFMNLADDLHAWLAHGTIARDVLRHVSEELRQIVQALDTGAPISPIPTIPFPPHPAGPAVLRRADEEPPFDDDEIPF